MQQLVAHQERLQGELKDQGTKTQKVGQTNLQIQDLQFNLAMDRELFEEISRQIKTMEMERQGRPRITPAYSAYVVKTDDRRPQLAIAMVFAGLAAGAGLAFLRHRMDKTLQTPEDMTRYLGLPEWGRPRFPYDQARTFCRTIATTNIRSARTSDLLPTRMPKILSVCSPGTREANDVCINLATVWPSRARKVLLIDGDCARLTCVTCWIANGSVGVQEVLLGEKPNGSTACSRHRLHVLAANARNWHIPIIAVYSTAAEPITRSGRDYDHVIVETPPALAFPMPSYGPTDGCGDSLSVLRPDDGPDLANQGPVHTAFGARVVGAIHSNVRVDQGLYRTTMETKPWTASPSARPARQKNMLPISPRS